MKKLIMLLNVTFLVTPILTAVVSCGDKTIYGTDLSELEDYSWKKEEPYFEGYQNTTKQNIPTNVEKNISLAKENSKNYIDYSSFNTSFKTANDVKKQSPTGVPLNSHFMPNGNFKKDLQVVPKSDIFDESNSILDWSYDSDRDAKYNVSRIPLQKTTKTAKKWISSQDKNIQEMNMSTVIESTSLANTIVGNNRAYARGINNYQYNDITVSWGGAADEGILLPPASNEVQKAHMNGTKILGNIFLDGYHGLKVEMLRDFIKQDSSGNYLIVDKLIDLAKQYQFDGWFWNNEPNGYSPDGSIISYKKIIEIMKQWNNKVKNSNDSYIKNLTLFSYKNNGSLGMDDSNKQTSDESVELYNNSDYFLSDFGQNFNSSERFTNNNKEAARKVFNMYNVGGWVNEEIYYNKDRIGRYDTKQLAYKYSNKDETEKGSDGKPIVKYSYDNSSLGENAISNSVAMFASQDGYDVANSLGDQLKNVTEVERDIYKLVSAAMYDDMLYTGHNRVLDEKDKGVITYTSDNKKLEKYSYGMGHIIQENTVLNDNNNVFFTNFSTGNGKMFNSINDDGKITSVDNYPWSNSNIGDVQPTYKWRIASSTDQKLQSSDKVSGYYDYYNPYLKGNSISLGSGFNDKGEIQDFDLESSTNYDWWIMGSNYSANKNKKVEFVVKTTGDLDPESIKVIYDTTKDNEKSLEATKTTTKKLENDWTRITGEVNSGAPISKLGINFKGGKGTVKVGEMKVLNSDSQVANSTYNFDKVTSELDISRDSGLRNYRLNFDNLLKDSDLYSYYEIYGDYSNKILRIAEGNKNDYYIKNIDWNCPKLYIKLVNNLNSNVKWFSIDL
ncbi:endo-beta-N-acetylglucosaminidase [Spiroplasma litorale]|uniref:Endo-beta-N-acetylglucosaminidase n=1 Tax=Spiroplasma litorale TaxID=216942 RepID=A0A0K1W1U9_9MOLU|nr:hypothetical protein [Spiroplasma litorale]AKX34284.1 endo-beta-N-acetylglucosaminidase [Spiroplasma litorale]